jgi:hypothetical protein
MSQVERQLKEVLKTVEKLEKSNEWV